MMDQDERDERNRRRNRALAQEIKRACTTIASGISQWLADDPDGAFVTIIPGNAQDFRPSNRPGITPK